MTTFTSSQVEIPDDPRAAFEAMYERGWTDGLPVVPPRDEYVRKMLEANGLNGDEVIAELAPAGATATTERIAINAVMAGCRDDYLPVLIAAVQAMAQPQFNLLGIQGTTNPVAPCVLINGPIRQRIGLNCGRGALGPGNRANATIGRAVRLIMLNIGGGKPGEIDKAQLGMPGKYTCCFGEAEEDSPWAPFHVDLGYAAEQSTVSVIGVQGTQSVRTTYLLPESILMVTADAMAVYGNNGYNRGLGHPLVVFSPGHARIFEQAGWSKRRVREWLFEHSKVPLAALPTEPSQARRKHRVLDGDDRICLCREPGDIVIVVAGSPEPYHVTYLPNFGSTDMATAPVPTQGGPR